MQMIPGELMPQSGEIVLNEGRATVKIRVANTGDRPIQIGSHFHFFETNTALAFERTAARGFRLDIPSGASRCASSRGSAARPMLVAIGGDRIIHGFGGLVDGKLED